MDLVDFDIVPEKNNTAAIPMTFLVVIIVVYWLS